AELARELRRGEARRVTHVRVHQVDRPALARDGARDVRHAPPFRGEPTVRDAVAPRDGLEGVEEVVGRRGAHPVLRRPPPGEQDAQRGEGSLERQLEVAAGHREDVHLDRRRVLRQQLGLFGEEDPREWRLWRGEPRRNDDDPQIETAEWWKGVPWARARA